MTAQFIPVGFGFNLDLASIQSTIAKGTFTLSPNVTSTFVTVAAITAASSFAGTPTPLTPQAANDQSTNSYAIGNGQFVVTHASNSRIDRTFSFVILI